MTTAAEATFTWSRTFLRWLTPRRLRAQAVVLALCLWGVCTIDFATPGLLDRAGNIKFQDFLPLYISAKLVAQHRANDLYNPHIQREELESIVGPTQVQLPYLYGPQMALLFVPLAKFSFLTAARIWTTISLLIYFTCIYAVWNCCPSMRQYSKIVSLAAIAFPPLFHVFTRGQISALIIACFTAAFLAFRSNRLLLAGVALGFLVLKPQFLIAIPLTLLLALSWKPLMGVLLSAAAQLTFARLFFGSEVMQTYFDLFRFPLRWIHSAELSLAPIQMHSLRSFWTVLIPAPRLALALYVLTSVIVVGVAASVWRSQSVLPLRFAALTLAAILVNPHLFIYDLLVLAPALVLVVDWSLTNQHSASTPWLPALSYLAFIVPLFGPLSRWTHLQVSVLVFVALLWMLHIAVNEHRPPS
ncbi:MAG TPA: glycosyltransferase family 87 protein [Candidatus Acidoferrum sp.]|nr:glycosyltransferase family 87 protein [Candidatus Acidoferrum sp.]